MHEDFKAFSQKPTQKFHNNFINFEKPQKIFKNLKTWVKNHEMHEYERFRDLPSEEELD